MGDPVRLFAAWLLALIAGALLSGLALAPRFGPWTTVPGALVFSLLWLGPVLKRSGRRAPGAALENRVHVIREGSCHPQVRVRQVKG